MRLEFIRLLILINSQSRTTPILDENVVHTLKIALLDKMKNGGEHFLNQVSSIQKV